MPKLSVYVSDDLWERAKHAAPTGTRKLNNSQVVQAALEQMATEVEFRRTSIAAGASRDDARLAQVVAMLRDDARAEYTRGYSAGLELAAALGFQGLKLVMNVGGLKADRGGLDFLSVADSEDDVGKWWDEHGAAYFPHDEDWDSGSEAFQDGVEQAITDVWETLRSDSWGTAGTGTSHENEEEGEAEE
jgi:hypothetical protein